MIFNDWLTFVHRGLLYSFLGAVIESSLFWLIHRPGVYDWRETWTTWRMIVMTQTVVFFSNIFLFIPALMTFKIRLFPAAGGPGTGTLLVALFLLDFLYYWMHRWTHWCRLAWLSHTVHHGPRHFNLSMAARTGPGESAVGFLMVCFPLTLAGFRLSTILYCYGLLRIYQFFVHSRFRFPMGWFGLIFVTPADHQIHHAKNQIYLNKNFGGILIIFDRIFGTYQKSDPTVEIQFGSSDQPDPRRLLISYFGPWATFFRDVKTSPRWQDKLRFFYKPIGWKPYRDQNPNSVSSVERKSA